VVSVTLTDILDRVVPEAAPRVPVERGACRSGPCPRDRHGPGHVRGVALQRPPTRPGDYDTEGSAIGWTGPGDLLQFTCIKNARRPKACRVATSVTRQPSLRKATVLPGRTPLRDVREASLHEQQPAAPRIDDLSCGEWFLVRFPSGERPCPSDASPNAPVARTAGTIPGRTTARGGAMTPSTGQFRE